MKRTIPESYNSFPGSQASELVAWAENECQQVELGMLGLQLSVFRDHEHQGSLHIGTDALDRPLTDTSLSLMRCAICKPVQGLVVAKLVEEGVVDYDTPVAHYLDNDAAEHLNEITLSHLMLHLAGMHRTDGLQMNLVNPELRRWLAANTVPDEGFRVGYDHQYSDSLHGLLVAHVIEQVTGRTSRELSDAVLFDDLGLNPANIFMGMTDEEFMTYVERLRIAGFISEGQLVPNLVENGRTMQTEWNPSWGGTSTINELARLSDQLLRVYQGARLGAVHPGVLARAIEPFTLAEDATQADRDFFPARGFFRDLGTITGLPDVFSSSSFGHFGYTMAFTFADPAEGIACALRFFGTSEIKGSRRRQWNSALPLMKTIATAR